MFLFFEGFQLQNILVLFLFFIKLSEMLMIKKYSERQQFSLIWDIGYIA